MVVDSMSPQRKMVYILSRVRGLSNDEIAVKLGIHKKTVENHLNLALRELKNVISTAIVTYFFVNELVEMTLRTVILLNT